MGKIYVCYFMTYDLSTSQTTRSDAMVPLETVETRFNGIPLSDSLIQIDAAELDETGRYYPK